MARRPAIATLVATAGLGLSAACATVPEFRALEREVVELKRTRNVPGDQQVRLAEIGAEVRELRAEIGRLEGLVEELRFALEETRADLASRGPVGGGAAPAPTGPAYSVAPGDPADPALATSGVGPAGPPGGLDSEVKAYEEAFRRYRADDFGGAIEGFRAFLQTYPTSDYADNALFWLAECYFKQGDFQRAAVSFEDVAKKYPDGNKVPDALYRQGIALLEIGGQTGKQAAYRGAARQIFKRIVEQYPNSERVPEARRQLEKLGT